MCSETLLLECELINLLISEGSPVKYLLTGLIGVSRSNSNNMA